MEEDGKYFCNDECLIKHIKSRMVRCCDKDCDKKFIRQNGFRFEGKWYCKLHFERYCIDMIAM